MASIKFALSNILSSILTLFSLTFLFFTICHCNLVTHLESDCQTVELHQENEISENKKLNETLKNCRVVLGFVILRQININSIEDDMKISFPNLEVIRDFLFIDHIISENASNPENSLNLIFPRLKYILGHIRSINETLSISRYDASHHLGLDSVKKICGPIKIFNSPRVCFRHTSTYWNWVSHFTDSKFNFPMPIIDNNDFIPAGFREDGLFGKLIFRHQIKEKWKKKHNYSQAKKAYFIFYHIDNKYFQFLDSGRKSIGCSDSSTFLFSDVVYTHYYDMRILKEFYNKSIKPSLNLTEVDYFSTLLHPPRELLKVDESNNSYERLFDILSLKRFPRQLISPLISETPGNYLFKFGEYYIIKLEICFGDYHNQCEFSQIRLFNPQKNGPRAPAGALEYAFWTIGLVIGLGVALFVLFRSKSFIQLVMNMNMSYRQVQVISVNPGYSNMSSLLNSWSSDNQIELSGNIFCEIDRSRIVMESCLIGKGEFGVVFEGLLYESGSHLTASDSKGAAIKVAIKQLKESSNPIEKERFIKEAKFMKSLESYYIIKLFGVCTVEDPMLVVMEYMVNGDLKTFLRRRYEEYLKTNNIESLPNFDRMTQMAIQIADGMYFLHSHKVIHRDLAARNMMVNEDLTIKIGDFGLTRDLYEREYYRISEETMMPLRWMAPESVSKMVFTYSTDVWSYGVVLREIMTFGEMPYSGETDLVVRQMIIDGVRLAKPQYCCPPLWSVARQCWRKNPNWRLTFKQIIDILYMHLNINRLPFDKNSYYFSSRSPSSTPQNAYQKFVKLFVPNRVN